MLKDSQGENIDLLANTTGSYNGKNPRAPGRVNTLSIWPPAVRKQSVLPVHNFSLLFLTTGQLHIPAI